MMLHGVNKKSQPETQEDRHPTQQTGRKNVTVNTEKPATREDGQPTQHMGQPCTVERAGGLHPDDLGGNGTGPKQVKILQYFNKCFSDPKLIWHIIVLTNETLFILLLDH
ncbi:Hypothetical predicted protein [Scomber scombrus]|uniref:Uncharacterized protein n=1 Tax=Scomber scombrus TaxID=13677 RepID=A0AAV1PHV6_SCOSC